MTLDRFSREDQYLAEALWHVRARNDAWSTDVGRAWSENRVLEKYFSPVLAITSYLTPDGVKWPDGQRADAQARAASAPRTPFVSKADPAAPRVLGRRSGPDPGVGGGRPASDVARVTC